MHYLDGSFKEELASEEEFKGVADSSISAPADEMVKKFNKRNTLKN